MTATPHLSGLTAPVRLALAAGAVLNLVFAAGFALNQSWATSLWPWQTGPLSHRFLGSMLAAVAAGAGWIAFSGETGSLPAGFLNLTVTFAGLGVSRLLVADDTGFAVAVLLLGIVNLALFLVARRMPRAEDQPLSPLVRGSYVAFTLILLAVGIALILRAPVLPWPVDPDTSLAFGWIFFGDAFYFAYALTHPWWSSARAQLWSFLAYDAVLLPPLVAHTATVPPELATNLTAYLVVLVYSGALGIAYLLLNRRTRGW